MQSSQLLIWISILAIFGIKSHKSAHIGPLEGTYGRRLEELRSLMKEKQIHAYIVPSSDDHGTESVAPPNKRREFISGFTGSMGTAVVTSTEALLWTDSRYTLQAKRQLPSFWKLMTRDNDTSIEDYLKTKLSSGETAAVDPKKLSARQFINYATKLNGSRIAFLPLEENLIDKIWTSRPNYKEGNIYQHSIDFAGEQYYSKLKRLRHKMADQKVDLHVVTKLDEIAWLLNLRGFEGGYTPTFIAYAIVDPTEVTLYTNMSKVPSKIVEYLNNPASPVTVAPYDQFWNDWVSSISNHSKIVVPLNSNYQVYMKVPTEKLVFETSLLLDMKAVKNSAEINATRNAHIRDSIAICKLYSEMEEDFAKGVHWDEMKVAEFLAFYRSQQKFNMGESFPSIIAFGPNSALPHYFPTPETNLKIDTSAPVTLDTGGQYLDGTIDTTRVWHFGTPTSFHKQVYTALLQGVADAASTIFPARTSSSVLDFLMRRPLLKLGLTFGHGTTHGTGVFLEVHEDYNGTMHENFIGSQEPGFYKSGDFGMRLENLLVVVPASVQSEENPRRLLTFSPLTLVPYETKLIDVNQMDKSQIHWLNEYHGLVRKQVGDEMIKQRLHDLYKWLMNKTNPIQID